VRVFFNILRSPEWLNFAERRKLVTNKLVGLTPAVSLWAVDADQGRWVFWCCINLEVALILKSESGTPSVPSRITCSMRP